ncbi:hypothetical protein IAG44_18650 [Streptomyces roseirectus]|uniref:Uncharacterized protein n=1 Tax=Streptomyces roseirectus TaxID=2768066 RepID=A0A7H0IEP5_9ACTN|nr:hypothetical protein [Streptomyces roseirectus]QNP71261.1 hypothetical protein IAG44_18650 [Streptomyces roseirectus]
MALARVAGTATRATSEPPAAESGHLYAISPEDVTVWSWSSRTGWKRVGHTPAGVIAAGPAGLFATDPVDDRIFRYDGVSRWDFVGTGADGQTLAVGDRLWVRDSRAVRQWDPSTPRGRRYGPAWRPRSTADRSDCSRPNPTVSTR